MRTFKRLFEPIKIGNLELKNRIKMPAMAVVRSGPEDSVIGHLKAFYTERARGGVGIIGVSCTPTRLIQDPMVGLYDDRSIGGLKELTGAVHDHGAKIYAQMGVGYSWAFGDGPVELIGPSGISLSGRPGTPFRLGGPLEPTMPRALTVEEIHRIADSYGDGARRAVEAGFDAVEVIASVGYVVAQFLSPLTNKRTDEYGGSLDNRMRFLLEIVKNIKMKVGYDFPCTCRLSGADLLEGGYTLEDTTKMAQMLERAGIHEIDVMSGWHNASVPILQTSVPQGAWAFMSEAVKKAVRIPIAAGTQVQDVTVAENLLRDGKADLIYMARALLADPELPNKAREGRHADIRPCINCCRCIEAVDAPPIYCSVNPRVSRERDYPHGNAALIQKRVLVIGAGPAGIEAARSACQRGHRVTLCEQGPGLGGSLIVASMNNVRIRKLVKCLCRQMETLPIDLRLNTDVTTALLEEVTPYIVVVAVGASPLIPKIPGIDQPNVIKAIDILQRKKTVGKRVVVVGGGMVGCETAEFLAGKGKQVTIIEMLPRIASDIGPASRWVVRQRLKKAGVTEVPGARVVRIDDSGVWAIRDGADFRVAADSVIIAAGMRSNKLPLPNGINSHLIGDCDRPSKVLEAMASGFLVAQKI